jgi:hypothetical protein
MALVLKILLGIAAAAGLFFVAGMSGILFYVWPTSVGDYELSVTPSTLQQLAALRAERKFEADKSAFYFGAPNEQARAAAQAEVDAVIDSLTHELPSTPRRSVVLKCFKFALARFDTSESEERDQFLVYLQRIMVIVGVKSSGELFNVWRYGLPYGWFISATPETPPN